MKRSLKWSWLALVAVTLLTARMSLHSQAQTQNQAPGAARSRSDEMLDRWNDIGNKLVAMAKDFPEDKYDFKVQKDQRTFAQNLLHAAALDFVPDQTLGQTSARATILLATLSRLRLTW
jgi:hypothetical protein